MSFSLLLRRWRRARGLSQLALAGEAGISARHLSFLETGRARPSAEMAMQLGATLDLPLRARNELLVAAGFAPTFRETVDLDAPHNSAVAEALRFLLKAHHPNPAIVMNRRWDILMANRAASRFSRFFIGQAASISDHRRLGNAAHLYLAPDLFAPSILDWGDVARSTLANVRRDAATDPSAGGPADLLGELLAYPAVAAMGRGAAPTDPPPLLATRLAHDGVTISYATLLTSFGTAADVFAEELRIKTFMPLDAATRDFFARIAARESDLIAA
ncbi:helix-turn-helix transcriptional regulator [Sandaracinobacteroides saxicola]|uniref:Helix-turn-helix transcriptional regulator n=1 Tax=Sandaracinobacteroides saxicola TaxID=2759707 RepID=A0A7G5IGM2_9SPHN|nr:helix-turn-helix transcriptional regulator [Sandaracinobacteroides saxicola]QMW22514.1 helix-turn-helix transcriptional regulator [Sandaracinobacteroides saxicola]